MKSHTIATKEAKSKNRITSPNIGKDMEQAELSYIIGGIINCETTFGETGSFFQASFKILIKVKI